MKGKEREHNQVGQNDSNTSRYVLFSDIHGNYANAADFTKGMYGFRSDRTFCLGDIVNEGDKYVENRTIDEVRKIPKIRVVKGNHDEILDGDYDFQKMTPDNIAFVRGLKRQIREGKVLATHSSIREPGKRIRNNQDAFREANYVFEKDKSLDFLFVGHTHKPAIFSYNPTTGEVKIHQGKKIKINPALKYIVNPGTLGVLDAGEVEHTFSVVDTTKGEILTYTLEDLKDMDLRNRAIQYFNREIMPNLKGDYWTAQTLEPHIQRIKKIGLEELTTPAIELMQSYSTKKPFKKQKWLDKFSFQLAQQFEALGTDDVVKNYHVERPTDLREKTLV